MSDEPDSHLSIAERAQRGAALRRNMRRKKFDKLPARIPGGMAFVAILTAGLLTFLGYSLATVHSNGTNLPPCKKAGDSFFTTTTACVSTTRSPGGLVP